MNQFEPIINYLVDPKSGLRQVITEFLKAVMQYEAYQQIGALPYERTPERKAHRNGTRPRTLKIERYSRRAGFAHECSGIVHSRCINS